MSPSELLTRAVEQVVPLDLAKKKLATGKPLRLYLGIDPTGAKLHLGHSVPLRKLKAFADAGHEVIFLVGSFTAMVGDPSGRDQMREPLTREQVERNFETYKQQAGCILDFNKIDVRYNHEWHDKLSFGEIMQLASHFTVQQMMRREMFRRRMSIRAACPKCGTVFPVIRSTDIDFEKIEGRIWEIECPQCGEKFRPLKEELIDEDPVSPNEFLYPLMQGYDSVMLDVDFEIGGSDQLFNMLCGRKLQKIFKKREKCVLTTKLIEGFDGRKMSKTYDNCIWLEDPASDMYSKTMRVKDELIVTYLECCTDLPMSDIADAEKKMKKGENPMTFKKMLAREIVRLYHDEKAAAVAESEFTSVFSEGNLPEDMPEITAKKGESLLDLLLRAKLIPSKAEGRRLMQQGGIHLNDAAVSSIDAAAQEGVVKVGKRKFAKIVCK